MLVQVPGLYGIDSVQDSYYMVIGFSDIVHYSNM